MYRYRDEAMCPKCGCRHISVKYEKRTTFGGVMNLLRRMCVRCGYDWLERPLDHKEED